MTFKKVVVTSFAGAIAFALSACSDDVTNIQNSELSMIEAIDSLECTKKAEGSMVFEKSSTTMYVCTDEEWVPMSSKEAIDYRCKADTLKNNAGYKIICDGDTLATIMNGKDGKDGTDGSNGKDGTDGSNGKDGKDGTDGSNGKDGKDGSEGKNGQNGTDGSCQVTKSDFNNKGDTYLITITCGDEDKTIELPIQKPNPNLSKVYNKKVSLRILNGDSPMISLIPAGSNHSAKVTIFEVDSTFKQTGKNFTFDIPTTQQATKVLQDDKIASTNNLITFDGDIEVSNMISPYAIIRVETQFMEKMGIENTYRDLSKNYTQSTYSYSAAVDLSDTSRIYVSFFTDMKTERVQKLVESGKTFAEATKQANDELYAALHYNATDELFEKMDMLYLDKNLSWLLLEIPSRFRTIAAANSILVCNDDNNEALFADFYSRYKKNFAAEGNLDTPEVLKCTRDYNYIKTVNLYFDEFVILFNTTSFPEKPTWNQKPMQKIITERYNLEECNKTYTGDLDFKFATYKDTNNFFPYFVCNAKEGVWTPIMLEKELNYLKEIDFSLEDEALVQKILDDFLGECSKKNVNEHKEFMNYQSYCLAFGNEYKWVHPKIQPFFDIQEIEADVTKECDPQLANVFAIYEDTLYACIDGSWVKQTGDMLIDKKCNKDNIGKISTIHYGQYFLCKTMPSSEDSNDSIYIWASYSSSSEIAPYKANEEFGECDEKRVGEIRELRIADAFEGQVEFIHTMICDDRPTPSWRIAHGYELALGLCNREIMDGSIHQVDNSDTTINSVTTGYSYATCAYIVNPNNDTVFFWKTVNDSIALKLNKVCNETLKDSVINDYTCVKSVYNDFRWVFNETTEIGLP